MLVFSRLWGGGLVLENPDHPRLLLGRCLGDGGGGAATDEPREKDGEASQKETTASGQERHVRAVTAGLGEVRRCRGGERL